MGKVKEPRLSSGQRVLNSFRALVKALRVADRAGVKNYGLGASQMYVLHELRRTAPLSINDLAHRMATDQSTVSVVVEGLVRKGHVARERSAIDGRRADLVLTRKGQTAARRLPPPFQLEIIAAVDGLATRQGRALADALHEVVSRMGVSDDRPPMLLQSTRRRKK